VSLPCSLSTLSLPVWPSFLICNSSTCNELHCACPAQSVSFATGMDIWFDLYSKNAFASLRNTICHPYVCLCLIGACTLALSNFGEGLGLVGIWDPHIRRQANPPSQAEEGSIRRTSGARAHRAVPEPLRRCVTRRDATRRDATRRNAAGFERQTRSEFSELLACTCQAQEQRGVERCAAARTIAAQAIKLCNREQRDHGPTSWAAKQYWSSSRVTSTA